MCSSYNWNARVQIVHYVVNQQNNLKETFKYCTSSKAHSYIFWIFLKFFSSSFQSREQWSVFDETSCWNASHQCSCSSADFHAALGSSCTVFHISVVRNGLCRAHPKNRKVVRLTFPTAFICKSSFSHPKSYLVLESWKCGWIGYTKPTFKSYLRNVSHFCGLIWLYFVA